MPSIIMERAKATSILSLLLFGLQGASAQGEEIPKGAKSTNKPPGFWGVDAEAVEAWQSYLAEPDASGIFTLLGNISQPWSGAEPLDWTIRIAVRADMAPPNSPDGEVLTGGLVAGDDYTANEEWNPFSLYYTSYGLSAPQPDEPLTPFFHRDPGDDRSADGTCTGILPDACIEYLVREADTNPIHYEGHSHRIIDPETCPGVSGATRLDLGSPFNLTRRGQEGAAMPYNEGWLASFSSEQHAQGNATDYAAHGSQYIPILFRWMRADTENMKVNEPTPNGPISTLIWSTEDAVATGVTVVCPQPKTGDYICGLQVRAQVIKTKGKVHHYYSDECPKFDDKRFVDFEVEAPYVLKGGTNEQANAVASFQACVLSCPDDASNMDCDGVRSALEGNIPICPGSAAKKNKFEEGWCTAHIVQRQRWQGIVNDRFMFDLGVFDGKGTSIYSELHQEVDETGRFSVKSVLPYTIEIKTTVEDNDFVEICYAGQCFSCDDNDGGTHKCTLGNGDEHGYEGGDREGDIGLECKHRE
ncbi:uncharacterized protein DNG_05281 [Cephalotrichum gorgonifer]|uniref:Uncharacterized protein n=1 Tax=Cephalotrichum gorgonifer TaxID=2041049 RepID=A0AAE8SVE0_9PEZI|nr:uncharacterized protein DNG_05281 [Cephalotrichum gorgonifer]